MADIWKCVNGGTTKWRYTNFNKTKIRDEHGNTWSLLYLQNIPNEMKMFRLNFGFSHYLQYEKEAFLTAKELESLKKDLLQTNVISEKRINEIFDSMELINDADEYNKRYWQYLKDGIVNDFVPGKESVLVTFEEKELILNKCPKFLNKRVLDFEWIDDPNQPKIRCDLDTNEINVTDEIVQSIVDSLKNCKNCEHCQDCENCENCVHCYGCTDCIDCSSLYVAKNCKKCHSSNTLINCSNCKRSSNLENCSDLELCEYCKNCSECYHTTHATNCHQCSSVGVLDYLRNAYKIDLFSDNKVEVYDINSNNTNCHKCVHINNCKNVAGADNVKDLKDFNLWERPNDRKEILEKYFWLHPAINENCDINQKEYIPRNIGIVLKCENPCPSPSKKLTLFQRVFGFMPGV